MPGLLPDVDPDGLLEFSVVYTDRALNHMSKKFVGVMQDILGMLKEEGTLATFSDSGAHVCQEMGSSLQTHFLSYWVRKRSAFTLEEAIKKLTHDNAVAWEMNDRGLVREGYAADLVLFEEDRIGPQLPTVERDLPGGARRLVQKADGIRATIVNGAVAFEGGEATGSNAGTVLKGRLAT